MRPSLLSVFLSCFFIVASPQIQAQEFELCEALEISESVSSEVYLGVSWNLDVIAAMADSLVATWQFYLPDGSLFEQWDGLSEVVITPPNPMNAPTLSVCISVNAIVDGEAVECTFCAEALFDEDTMSWMLLSAMCETVVFTSNTGQWGNEMAWEVYNYEDEVLTASFQGEQDFASDEQEICLEEGCYVFVLYDSWGDGWNGGDVEISMEDGTSILIEMMDGSIEFQTFEVGAEQEPCAYELPGCTDPEALNFIPGATLDDGSCITEEPFFTSGDDQRSYILYLPENIEEDAPLVFVLHGYYGDAYGMSLVSGMSEIADAEGFAVCYPQGLPDFEGINHWNSNLGISNVNDVQFLTELAEFLQSTHLLSSECTYSCGYSNGGYMSYSLACASPDVFKAIGSVGGTMSGADWDTCEAQPVPVVHLHGTNDQVVPYGSTEGSNDPWQGAPGVEAVVAQWATWNGCTETVTTSLPDLDPTDGSTVDLISHSGSPTGYRADIYRVNDGGHDWFGAWGNLDIESSATMWSFWASFCSNPLSVSDLVAQPLLCSTQAQAIVAHENVHLSAFDVQGRMQSQKILFAGQSWEMKGHGIMLVVARNATGQTQQLKIMLTD